MTSRRTSWTEGNASFPMMFLSYLHPFQLKSAIQIIKNKLEQDTELHKRTSRSTNNIMELLEFCLWNTYFLFQGQLYEQIKGAAMGSPVSPIVANLYMEYFEHRTLTLAVNPPRLWKRYVDDTFVILQQSQKEEFLQHINSVDSSIKFTTEELYARWFHAIPGHTGFTIRRWNLNNQCLQKANSH